MFFKPRISRQYQLSKKYIKDTYCIGTFEWYRGLISTHVIQLYYMNEICIFQMFYIRIADVWITCVIHKKNTTHILQVFHTCNTHLTLLLVMNIFGQNYLSVECLWLNVLIDLIWNYWIVMETGSGSNHCMLYKDILSWYFTPSLTSLKSYTTKNTKYVSQFPITEHI